MITALSVEGYKSFRKRYDVPLAPLTLLAGANSSGKSSLLQGMLLLKQTLDLFSDPGPLYLGGPLVSFTRPEELKWCMEKKREIAFGVTTVQDDTPVGVETRLKARRTRRGKVPFTVRSCTWRYGEDSVTFSSTRQYVALEKLIDFLGLSSEKTEQSLPLETHRAFIVPAKTSMVGERFQECLYRPIERAIRGIVHVPALRGNPSRTYPLRDFTSSSSLEGPFLDYVASILNAWQRSESKEKAHLFELLQASLEKMGLTWKVSIRQHMADLQILVGRTTQPIHGSGPDLVNIADVGFGISQVLPVLVALLVAEPHQMVVIEQPELHLHPNAQVALAEHIAEIVATRHIQVVLETHSDLFLIALQRAIALGRLPADKVMLHWFERDAKGATKISTTSFHPDGTFTNPRTPVDFDAVAYNVRKTYVEASWRRMG